MKDLKLVRVGFRDAIAAVMLAEQFLKEYPDRHGFAAGVIYHAPDRPTFYIYQTKTTIVVRGN